jgi:hypothetical protein
LATHFAKGEQLVGRSEGRVDPLKELCTAQVPSPTLPSIPGDLIRKLSKKDTQVQISTLW